MADDQVELAFQTLQCCTRVLAALCAEGLRSQKIQQGIRDVGKFRRSAQSGTPKTRNRNRESDALESACMAMPPKLASRFRSAWHSVKKDSWDQPENSVFSETRIEGGETPILTLLISYKRSASVKTAGLRILSVLIAHDVDQCVETRNTARYDEIRCIWAQRSGMSVEEITAVERTGRWYMDFLELRPGVRLGALLMLGNNHATFGKLITSRYALAFAQACISIEGFALRAEQLAPFVLQECRSCAEQCGLTIDHASRLGTILTGETTVIGTYDHKLMVLLCQFRPERVPMELLQRGFVAQHRWDQSGKRIKVTPQETGLNVDLLHFKDHTELMGSLDRLSSAGKVVIDHDRCIHISPSVVEELLGSVSSEACSYWKEQALAMLCQSFPRGQTLDTQYRRIGQRLTPLVEYIAREAGDGPADVDLAATMLSASPLTQFDTAKYVEHILRAAPFSYLHVWAARRSLRRIDNGRTGEIRGLFENIGRLRATYAAHLCHYETLDQAEAVLSAWVPQCATEVSELEQTVADHISLVRAKIMRYRGEDEDARRCLETLKRHSQVKEDAFLADLTRNLLELTLDPKHIIDFPASMFGPAQKVLHTTLNRADTHFLCDRYDSALSDYRSAAEQVCSHTQHVRALIGIAKTTHCSALQSAEDDWLKAESVVAELEWSQGFAYGLIKLSLGVLTDDPVRIADGTKTLQNQKLAVWLVGGRSWVAWVCGNGRRSGH